MDVWDYGKIRLETIQQQWFSVLVAPQSSDWIEYQRSNATKGKYIYNNPVELGFVAEPEHWICSNAIDYSVGKGMIELYFLDWNGKDACLEGSQRDAKTRGFRFRINMVKNQY